MQRSLAGFSQRNGPFCENVQRTTTLHAIPSRVRVRGPVRLLASAQVYSHLISIKVMVNEFIFTNTEVKLDFPTSARLWGIRPRHAIPLKASQWPQIWEFLLWDLYAHASTSHPIHRYMYRPRCGRIGILTIGSICVRSYTLG